MTGYALFWIAGGNDLVATQFHVSLNSVTYFMRVFVFVGPVLAFLITKRICIALQRVDHERLLHGAESGVIVRSPSGGYHERHRPITQEEAYMRTQHLEGEPLLPVAAGQLPDKQLKKENRRRKATRFWYLDSLRKPTREELEDAAHHHGEEHDDQGYSTEDSIAHNGHHHEITSDGSEIDDKTEFKPAH
jgi:ubiquinol-cytochrome c reductase cytochrome b subunit